MSSSTRLGITVTALAMFLMSCNRPRDIPQSRQSSNAAVTVFTVNYPLKYFADVIGGEHVDVVFPLPAEGDPAFWIPDSNVVSDFQKADLILLNGAGYAKWVAQVTLPEAKLINTTGAVEDKYIRVQDAIAHRHGPGDEHTHDSTAFTTWLDPDIAIAQSAAIREALTRLRPEYKEAFERNFVALERDLQTLSGKLEEACAEAANQPVLFSHPVYQYLERKYRISGKSLHWEPDQAPSEDAWEELEDLLRDHPAKQMIWEGEPLKEITQRLSALDVGSVVFDPCGNRPASGDWLEVMHRNADKLAGVFGRSSQ